MVATSRVVGALVIGALAVGAPFAAQGTKGDQRDKRKARAAAKVCKTITGPARTFPLRVVGVTDDGRLICFRDHKPARARTIGKVRGLETDTKIVGIDYRPADRGLYGLGDKGGIYKIKESNGRAALVSRVSVALAGTSFGIDFDPVADRLRIVSDTGQNLSVDVASGAAANEAGLAYVGEATGATGVTAIAFTNHDSDPRTHATLFDLDTVRDQTVLQMPAGGLVPTGQFRKDAGPVASFDIYSKIRGGTTVSVHPRAALVINGRTRWYEMNVFPGRPVFKGTFRKRDAVVGVAIPLTQT
jgi:hypothetical protein